MKAPQQQPKLAAGLAYAAHGWNVFVLSPKKVPIALCDHCRTNHRIPAEMEACPCLTCHGFYAATTDPSRITAMLACHPEGMLAIRTGAPSGLVVLDLDERHGALASLGKLEAGVGVLPGTVTQYTPGGAHLLYAHPGHRVKSVSGAFGADLPGLDVKADGGYIVAAPSVNAAGLCYTFAGGDWRPPLAPWPAILSQLMEPVLPAPPAPMSEANRLLMYGSTGSGGPGGGYAAAALAGEVQRVLDTAAVGHGVNNALNTAALKLGRLVGAGLLERQQVVEELTAAALYAGMPANDIGDGQHRGTLASGLNAGIMQPRTPDIGRSA